MKTHYIAHSEAEAWKIANSIFPTDYEYDADLSQRAGYPVYPSTCSDYRFAKINDLCARLEVVLEDYTCINIWIEAPEAETETEAETVETEAEKAWKRSKNNVFRFQTEAEAWRHIGIIWKITETAKTDINTASAMLQIYNEITGVKYGFLAREVVFFADPDSSACYRFRHCYDVLLEYRCQLVHLTVAGK